jgi:hypothetical protein
MPEQYPELWYLYVPWLVNGFEEEKQPTNTGASRTLMSSLAVHA